MSVTVAANGGEGKRLIGAERFDLVILDVNLPVISGLELAQYLCTRNAHLSILMLTALDSTADKLMGFEAGADDYLAKPFGFLELVACVRALLLRSDPAEDTETALRLADLELHLR